MKLNAYTVIAQIPDDDSVYIYRRNLEKPEDAEPRLRKEEDPKLVVMAVFEGHLDNLLDG